MRLKIIYAPKELSCRAGNFMEAKNVSFEEMQIGSFVEFNVTVTKADVKLFAKLSGDYNPLHFDWKYAKMTKFGKPIVHGMLVASYLSRLVGMHLPGKRALFLSQTLTFRKPVYAGQKLLVCGKVISKSNSTRIIELQTDVTNNKGIVVLSGSAKVKVL